MGWLRKRRGSSEALLRCHWRRVRGHRWCSGIDDSVFWFLEIVGPRGQRTTDVFWEEEGIHCGLLFRGSDSGEKEDRLYEQ
jgi:hypothetical protein